MRYPKDVLSIKQLVALPYPPDCRCEECVSNCEGMPGWFLPGQPAKAAEFLGLSLEEAFKQYFQIEYWIDTYGKYGDVYVLAPARRGRGGTYATWSEAFDRNPCIFLNENKTCRIHEVKPWECKFAGHMGTQYVQRMLFDFLGIEVKQRKNTHKSIAWAWLRYPMELKTIIGEGRYA